MNDAIRIERALRYLEDRFRAHPRLEEVAQAVHLSPFHFHRLFRRWAGITPKQFVQYLTAEYAKQQLARSRSVLDTAYAAGLSGPGRLHDLLVSVEAMTPGAYKAQGQGLLIRYGFQGSPFGDCLVAETSRGICGIAFVAGRSRREALRDLQAQWPDAKFQKAEAHARQFTGDLFKASPCARSMPLKLIVKGTHFQTKVWEALLRIPPGFLLSYGDVARQIGHPRSERAVGSAVGKNPIAVLIPCHRVIRKLGQLGGYRWGLSYKKALIAWEAARKDQKDA